MDTREITKEYRLSQWAEIIQARNESGKSIKEFCENNGIENVVNFVYEESVKKSL